MIFSSELLNNQESKIKTPEKKLSVNCCFFIEAMEAIIEENNIFESIMLSKDQSINEGILGAAAAVGGGAAIYKHYKSKNSSSSDNEENKSSKSSIFNTIRNFDFSLSNIISKLVEGFINIIKKLFREFEVICMNIVSKNDQIKRFKNKISLIGEKIKYSEAYYNYTNIRNSTSYADIETSFRNDFNILSQTLLKFDRLTESEINTELNKIQFESNYLEYDELRGNLLGTNQLISEEAFATELFKYFRNYMDEPFIYGYIDPNDLHQRLKDWELAPKTIKLCQKDKDKMEKAGKNLVNDFKKINTVKFSNGSSSKVELLNTIVNNYIHKTKNICNIYLLYFASKLDAAKEELITNKKILFEVCKYIVREGL